MEWVLETENVIQRSKQCSRRVIIENEDRYLAQTARYNRSVNASLMEVPDLQLKLIDIGTNQAGLYTLRFMFCISLTAAHRAARRRQEHKLVI